MTIMSMLTTNELAARWKLNPKSLSNWRSKGIGPVYVKLGEGRSCKIVYRVEDIQAFEQRNVQIPGAPPEERHNI
jgi:hypothetical protein